MGRTHRPRTRPRRTRRRAGVPRDRQPAERAVLRAARVPRDRRGRRARRRTPHLVHADVTMPVRRTSSAGDIGSTHTTEEDPRCTEVARTARARVQGTGDRGAHGPAGYAPDPGRGVPRGARPRDQSTRRPEDGRSARRGRGPRRVHAVVGPRALAAIARGRAPDDPAHRGRGRRARGAHRRVPAVEAGLAVRPSRPVTAWAADAGRPGAGPTGRPRSTAGVHRHAPRAHPSAGPRPRSHARRPLEGLRAGRPYPRWVDGEDLTVHETKPVMDHRGCRRGRRQPIGLLDGSGEVDMRAISYRTATPAASTSTS